jgi:lipopolysaccharide transport system permease protein
MLGICFLLASLGAWIRDLREFIGILANIGLYAAPILFLPATMDAFPRAVRYAFYANPFSHMVWCYQDAIAFGHFEHPASWIVFPICALGVALIGTVLFDRVRHSLPEVL